MALEILATKDTSVSIVNQDVSRNQSRYSFEVRWEIGAAAFDHRKLPITCHVIFPVTVISRFFRVSCLCRITVWNVSGTLWNVSGTLWNATTTVQDFCWNAFLVIFITPSSRHRHVKRYLDSYLERYGISKLAPTYRNIIRQYLQ